MECTYCGAELDLYDSYGNRQDGKQGDIYICPNHDGFDTVDDVKVCIGVNSTEELEDYLRSNCLESWEQILCDSSCHSVSGSFYTDKYEDLYEGYPC